MAKMVNCHLCDYKAASTSVLKQHQAFKHNIGVVWHTCDLCTGASPYKAKSAGNLRKHKANVHDIGTVIYSCDLCEFTAKSSGNLKKHKAYAHDIDVTWHHCVLCDFKCKKAANLREHTRKCRVRINMKAKKRVTANQNTANKDGCRKWACHMCAYRSATEETLNKHKRYCHDIDV